LAWTIEYTKTAREQLRKLDKTIARRLADYMDKRVAFLDNPRLAGKPLTGGLKGVWRYRVGDYRLICDIQDQVLTILVVEIGNRKDVYR
jgi:mRNA interferase RelE/StbE